MVFSISLLYLLWFAVNSEKPADGDHSQVSNNLETGTGLFSQKIVFDKLF